jgi:hypothetical protein
MADLPPFFLFGLWPLVAADGEFRGALDSFALLTRSG